MKNDLLADLFAAQKFAYEPSGFTISKLKNEPESQEYGACTFEMNQKRIQFRLAKITPTKTGQFVTLWKRIGSGPILPFDNTDPADLFVVSVRSSEYFGQFVFPKEVLCAKGIVSKEGKEGKRAMRVYPPWDIASSLQAKKTQNWQLLYFFEIHAGVDLLRLQNLFR